MIYIFNFLKDYIFFPADVHLVLFDQYKLKSNRIQMGKRYSFVLSSARQAPARGRVAAESGVEYKQDGGDGSIGH